jgi:hypothetical protein
MLFGSMTNDVIEAAKDERPTELKKKFAKWRSDEDALEFWSGRLTMVLDQRMASILSQTVDVKTQRSLLGPTNFVFPIVNIIF